MDFGRGPAAVVDAALPPAGRSPSASGRPHEPIFSGFRVDARPYAVPSCGPVKAREVFSRVPGLRWTRSQEECEVSEILVVQSKVREMIKGQGCSTSGDAVEALSTEVNRIIQRAVQRTKANGRKTVKGSDI
jgi:hypothetical protein